ncbi:hypothetical protein NYE67_20535 [Solibacillus sp. FSL W8-0474]|uniref:hypothetical protein n=1 Tax=Solibacillus sp. FSL W8-0474 TaxID=2975336 RepID=UPI0030F7F2F3
MKITELEEYKGELLERLYNTDDPKEKKHLLKSIESIDKDLNSLYWIEKGR